MVFVGRGCSRVGVLAVALASGCGLELADGDAAADGDTDPSPETGTTGVTGPDTNDTGPSDPSGLTGSDESGTTGAGGGTDDGESGDPTAACDALSCSGGGVCDDAPDGPVCVCDPGWASVGLDCIKCESVSDSMLPATVPTLRATVEFRIDGAAPPNSSYDYGRLSLRNRTSGDIVPLGNTYAGTATVLMVPGVYDVLFEHREGTGVPKNQAAVLDQVELDENDTQLTIDIPTATLRGSISFATEDEPASPAYDYGRLWLVSADGDRVRLGNTYDGVYDVRLVPGDYEVHYELRETQGNAPMNRDGLLGGVHVRAGSNTHDIEIQVARIDGDVLIDGAAVSSAYDNGDLELRDVVTGDRFPLAGTEAAYYAIPLLPGTYEVLYTSRELGAQAPINHEAVVHTLQVGKTDDTFDIDLQTAVVSGSFALNGAAAPSSSFDDGIITLESSQLGTARLGVTSGGDYQARVLVGDYDAFYGQDTAGVSMPVNVHGYLDAVSIQGSTTLDIDIPAVEVVGSLTIGGAAAPDSPYDDGRLFLRNAQTQDKVLLGNTREGTYAARVLPGTYDVIYENEFSDEFLPVNRGAVVLEKVDIADGGGPLDIDVPVSTLIGSVVIENATPSAAEGIGNLFLRDLGSGDEVFIGHTGAAEFTKPLADGTYIMEYRGVAASGATLGTSLPANANAAFACFEIVSG